MLYIDDFIFNQIVDCEKDRERAKTDPIEVGDDDREYEPEEEKDENGYKYDGYDEVEDYEDKIY